MLNNIHMLTVPFLILFPACMIVSSVGFFRFVYFISVGYGFSIAMMAMITILRHQPVPLPLLVQLVLLFLYGVRLGGYLLYRDFSASYRKDLEEQKRSEKKMTFLVKVSIWVTVALLYVLMFMPAYAHHSTFLTNTDQKEPFLAIAGIIVMAAGFIVESLADFQKSEYKRHHPETFISSGLYRVVRYPNYFGEILFWTGNMIAGASFLTQPILLIGSLIGYICIILIMFGSTRRLELKQEKRYGDQEAFREFTRMVPVLFPFIPLKSMKNIKVYLG